MTNFTKAQTGKSATVSGGTTVSASFTSNPGAGHVVCVAIQFYDGTSSPATVTVADDNANNYTVDATDSGSTNMATAGQIFLAYLINTPSNAHKTITATFNKANVAAAIYIDDFASSGTPSLDHAAQLASGTGDVTSPTVTVTTADDLLYSMASHEDHIVSVNSPWTGNEGGSQLGGFSSWVLSASSNTSVNYTGIFGAAWNCLGVSFKAGAAVARPQFVSNYRTARGHLPF